MIHFILFAVLVVMPVLAMFAFFDQLVRFEYRERRADWERDDRPIGFFGNRPRRGH